MNPATTLRDDLSSLPSGSLDVALFTPETDSAGVTDRALELASAGVAGIRVHPAALPSLVAATEHLQQTSPDGRVPRLGTVAGFPMGRSHVLVKAAEARLAVDTGAQDVAVVVDPSLIASGDANGVLMEMASIREAVAPPVQLTAIVETCLHEQSLVDDSGLTAVIEALVRAGVNAVATATGFHTGGVGGARQVELVAQAAAGEGVGVIAVVGDDDTPAFARELLEAGAHVVQVNHR